MSNYELIASKIVNHSEIVVCLFDHCNLRCTFCPQDHESLIGASREEILNKVGTITNWINNSMRSNIVKIHIMGGELFQDQWIKEGFIAHYQDFLESIRKLTNKSVTIIPNFITNLVFENTKPVLDFLELNSLKISVSYDPKGRFNADDRAIFNKNLITFAEKIEMVSIVMTKANINAVMDGDFTFRHLYDQYLCDWDQLLPATKNAKELMPSESESFEFYKFLIDNYPRCLNIHHFVSNEQNLKMTCTRGNSLTVMRDGSVPNGCSGAVFLKEATTQDLGGEAIVENFVTKYDCFQCKFFSKCPFTCFIKNDYKHIKRDMDICVFKALFEYVEQKY